MNTINCWEETDINWNISWLIIVLKQTYVIGRDGEGDSEGDGEDDGGDGGGVVCGV